MIPLDASIFLLRQSLFLSFRYDYPHLDLPGPRLGVDTALITNEVDLPALKVHIELLRWNRMSLMKAPRVPGLLRFDQTGTLES